MMTVEKYVEHWRHEFLGMVVEALRTDARGGELGLRITAIDAKIVRHLQQQYHQLTQEKSANGHTKKQDIAPRVG